MSQQQSALCPVCESTDTRHAHVRSAFWHDDRLVVIEDVPALACNVCGEQFYDDATVLLIDRMRQNGFPPEGAIRVLQVAVYSGSTFASPQVPSDEMMLTKLFA
jgi:YgiT-type zinc finger domain-containing protein